MQNKTQEPNKMNEWKYTSLYECKISDLEYNLAYQSEIYELILIENKTNKNNDRNRRHKNHNTTIMICLWAKKPVVGTDDLKMINMQFGWKSMHFAFNANKIHTIYIKATEIRRFDV